MKAALDELWSKRGTHDAYGNALLLLTLDLSKDPRANDLAKELRRRRRRAAISPGGPARTIRCSIDWEDTSVEATAMALKALAPHMATDPLIERAGRWLLVNRNGGYYWSSTKQTAFALMGLLGEIRARGRDAGDDGGGCRSQRHQSRFAHVHARGMDAGQSGDAVGSGP